MALTAAMESAFNTYLRMDPDAASRFARFEDKVIAIVLEGTGLTLYCLPGAQGCSFMSQYQGDADTTLSGRPVPLVKLGLLGDQQVMFDGEVRISGNVELGQQFKKALEQIDIDWEEHLSRITGDIIAHKTGNLIREMASWWRNNNARTQSNAREYLQRELNVLPTHDDVEYFNTGVETLRDDTARLEARIQQLHTTHKTRHN